MIFLTLLIVVCALFYVYLRWHFSYWQRKGFPCPETQIPFGVLDAVFRLKRSFGMAIYDVYKTRKEPFLGIYLMFRQALLIRDAQLAKDILSKDFASFHDRGVYVDEVHDPMSAGLFFLEGQKWKTLRTKLTPSFTSGKLKAMFGTVENIADKMLAHLNKIVPEQGYAEFEMQSLMKTYAIDIIGSAIFGLEIDSFADPKNEFFTLSKYINDPGLTSLIRGTAQFLYPNLEKVFVFLGWKQKGPEGMRLLAQRTIEYREKHNVERKDFLQLLLQLRNTGKINADDNNWAAQSSGDALKSLSVDFIAAQLFLFYIAGYETTSTSAAFTLYEFSQNPEILAKAKQDIQSAIANNGGILSYDSLQDMKYLDLCLMETVRKYPGLPILNRICTKNYAIPDTDKVIEKGTPIIISLFGLHRDPAHFPDPLRYHPERYLGNIGAYNPLAYMPFGDGPRHCIAQRMGKLNVKIAIAKILTNFNLETRKERREIEIAAHGVPIQPEGGIPVRLTRIN